MRGESNRKRSEKASLDIEDRSPEILKIQVAGRLDSATTPSLWRKALALLEASGSKSIQMDAANVGYCDISGIAFLGDLRERARQRDMDFKLQNFPDRYRHLLEMFPERLFKKSQAGKPKRYTCLPEEAGWAVVRLGRDLANMLRFVGELVWGLLRALRHPGRVRWDDLFHVVETAGVNALPIIGLIGFLLGLILAFQAAVPMSQFGAGIFVANLVALSLARELGPLMTAIMLAGRSGSSFAAELGTMKVNDEIDALVTMGLNPVFFLAVPRVLAGIVIAPLLTLFSIAFGLVGAGIMVMSMGYPLVTYVNRVVSAVTMVDFLGGLAKSVVFGVVVAAVGCMRGLQTRAGAQAVGESTTSSVVSSIVLIAVIDGIFAVLFYVLGI